MMKRTKLIYWLFVLGQVLVAQPFPQTTSNSERLSLPLIWADGFSVRCGEKELSFEGPKSESIQKVALPVGSVYGTFGQGASWSLVSSQDGQKILKSEDGKTWQNWGIFPPDFPAVSQFVPLEKNRIFIFGKMEAFLINRLASPLAIVSNTNKKWVSLESLEGLDLKEPLASIAGSPNGNSSISPSPLFNRKYKFLFQMSYAPREHLVQYPGGFAILVPQVGWVFLFNSQGKLQRRVTLVQDIDEKALSAYWAFEKVILGCRPRKDGTLLIATRSQEAVLKARKLFPILAPDSGRPMDPEVAFQNDIQAMVVFPEIEWWSLDPSTGGLAKQDSPNGIPGKFPSPERLPELLFTLLGDDTLLCDFHWRLEVPTIEPK